MTTLMRASCLLLGYESIRSEVIDQIRGFYGVSLPVLGYEGEEAYVPPPELMQEYEGKVKSRDKSIFRASCSWLVEMDALTEQHVADLEAIRSHRNEVAHELLRFLFDSQAEVNLDVLLNAREALIALGRFWGRIAVESNPANDGVEIDDSSIQSGVSIAFDYVLGLASISTETLGAALVHAVEHTPPGTE